MKALTGSLFGSNASTSAFRCSQLITLCWTLVPWHMTVNSRALSIWRQWWVQWRQRMLGVQRCLAAITCLYFAIESCSIAKNNAGSEFMSTSSAVPPLLSCKSWKEELGSVSRGTASWDVSSWVTTEDEIRLLSLSRCRKEAGLVFRDPSLCLGLSWSDRKLTCATRSRFT